jgi:hypothetical protein
MAKITMPSAIQIGSGRGIPLPLRMAGSPIHLRSRLSPPTETDTASGRRGWKADDLSPSSVLAAAFAISRGCSEQGRRRSRIFHQVREGLGSTPACALKCVVSSRHLLHRSRSRLVEVNP